MALSQVNLPISLLNPVNQKQNISPIQSQMGNTLEKEPVQSQFSDFLDKALNKMDNLQKEADSASLQLATGQIQDVHSVIIALEKANLGFSLAVEVRNKVLDAYHEAMRMQL